MTASTFCDPIILQRTLTYFLVLSNSHFPSQPSGNKRSLTAMLSSTAKIPRIVDSNPPRSAFPFFRALCCIAKRHAMRRSPVQGSQQTSTTRSLTWKTGDPGVSLDYTPHKTTNIHTHTHNRARASIHTYAYIYTYIHTYIYIHTHTYIHTYNTYVIHTYMHTYIHIYNTYLIIHTYIHT